MSGTFQMLVTPAFWVYVLIILIAMGFVCLYKHSGKIAYYRLSFLVVYLFICLSKTGTDIPTYVAIYKNSQLTWQYIVSFMQGYYGFSALTAILHNFISDPYVGLAFIKFTTLMIVYYTLYRAREKLDIGWSLFIYLSLYYLYSFSAIKWALSGALCLLASMLYAERKNKRALFFSVIGASIHPSCWIYVVGLVVALFFRLGGRYSKAKRWLLIIGGIVFCVFGTYIVQYALITFNIVSESRYQNYIGTYSLGIMQLLYYIPIFALIIAGSKYKETREYGNAATVFAIEGFSVALLGYAIGQLGRLDFSFSFPLLIYIPNYLKYKSVGLTLSSGKGPRIRFDKKLLKIAVACYVILRALIFTSGVFYSSGLDKISFVWQ